MKKIFLLFVFLTINLFLTLNAQNITITDDDGHTPDASAMLDVQSTSKGLLVPRVDSAQRVAIANPATGLLVFDTEANAFFYYDGGNWLNLSSKVVNPDLESTNMSLFSVVNNRNDTVFAVYPEGIRMNVGDGDAKGNRGGFAVGGLSSGGKLDEAQFLHVSPDSVRIYFDTTNLDKANRGGFAVGGLSSTGKGNPVELMNLKPKNYFIGHQSGLKTTGLYNSFIGYKSGINNITGEYNTFMGYQTGYNNNASYNTFLGFRTGFSNTDGSWNVFVGYESGLNNDSGDWNVFIGHQAGKANESGQRNVFVGDQSGYSNINGVANVYIGNSAGKLSTTAGANVFIGDQAGSNSTGSWNTFIGTQSGGLNTSGNNNLFAGSVSGQHNTTGLGNVFLGHYCGYDNVSGNYNVFIGSFTGVENESGNNNVYVGYRSGKNNLGNNNVFIGYESGLQDTIGSDRLFIENSWADSSNALIYGRFDNDSLWLNADVKVKYSLETGEGFKVGNSSKTENGVIRYTGTDFEGYHNGWVSLTSAKKPDTGNNKIYEQDSEPDIPDNTVAYWHDTYHDKYYQLVDFSGVQKKIELK